jgi:hypothetical protein
LTPGKLIFPVPSKDTPPIVLAVSKAVAVAALPVVEPDVPDTLPVTLAVIVAGSPIVIVPELSATSTSLEVPENVIVPPNAVAVELEPSVTVIDEFASFAFAIDPANSSLLTPLSFIVTAPDDTAKLSEEKLATPLFDVVASSPENVTVPDDSPTSIPSPAAKVAVPPKAIAVDDDPSVTVILELANLALAIDPASSSLLTPLSLIVTAPEETAKLSDEKLAIPLLEVVASSPAIVTVVDVAEVSIPSPPANC